MGLGETSRKKLQVGVPRLRASQRSASEKFGGSNIYADSLALKVNKCSGIRALISWAKPQRGDSGVICATDRLRTIRPDSTTTWEI